MFVSDWMTREVHVLDPSASIYEAYSLMTEKGIRHLPVAEDGHLKGILSDLDIQSFLPSKAESMTEKELREQMEKRPVRDAMTNDVVTTTAQTPIEKAALILLDHDIGCLPVVESGRLVGIIADQDIYRALVELTGIRHGGYRITVTVDDAPGAVKALTDIIRKYGFGLLSVLTTHEGAPKGSRQITARTRGNGDFAKLKMELEAFYSQIRIIKG